MEDVTGGDMKGMAGVVDMMAGMKGATGAENGAENGVENGVETTEEGNRNEGEDIYFKTRNSC